MKDDLFEEIHRSNSIKLDEALGASIILGMIGAEVLGGLGVIIAQALMIGYDELADNAIGKFLQEVKIRTHGKVNHWLSKDVKNLIDEHKEDFVGLSQRSSAQLLAKLLAEKYPEEVKQLKKITDYPTNVYRSRYFKDQPQTSDKKALAAARSKYKF